MELKIISLIRFVVSQWLPECGMTKSTKKTQRFWALQRQVKIVPIPFYLVEFVNQKISNYLSFEFFNESLPMLDAGMEKAKKYFTEAIDGKITFEKGADYETDPDKMKYATNDSELKDKWKNIVQWEVTTRWVEKIEEQKKKEVKEGLKTEEELKVEVIKEVKKRYVDFFDRVKKLRRSDRMETYLGSIANYFDPHTDYFSPKEKQDFDINMGGKGIFIQHIHIFFG